MDYGLKRQIQDAAVRGFINYLKKYEERKATNREPFWVKALIAKP